MSAQVITLGCRLNLAESATIAGLGLGGDLIVVNSCAVTNEAVRQTRQAIRRAKRTRPDARIVVTGCAAQVEPETFAAMPEVSRVVGNGGKLSASSYLAAGSLDPVVQPGRADSAARHSRAFVAVQNGCDHRCTFCIIPYGRGDSRSVPAGLVIEQVQAAVDRGAREVVLTGVDVTSYGPDLPGEPTLGMLVERILKHVPALPRLRLSSLDCVELDARLFELVTGEARVMPHLHLSLQAGDDMVLKRMKRRHSRVEAVALVERLKARRPQIAIGANLIAGFPTETAEMAANSLELIDDCQIVMGHVFPYSPKRGTPAARMPQVTPDAIRARARALREAATRRRLAWLKDMIGTTQRVLVERGGDFGHAENFAPVRVRSAGESSTVPAPPFSSKPPRLSVQEQDSHAEARRRGGGEAGDGFRRIRAGEVVAMVIAGVEDDALIGVPA